MNIYSSVDGKNIDKIIVLFNSVYINANKEKQSQLKFYLLVDKLPNTLPFIPEYLENILTIKELKLNKIWEKLLDDFNNYFYKSSKWCKSNMNFARFLFFNHFPEVDRVVYLDWDMIVLADIFELEKVYNSKKNMIVSKCGKQTTFTNIFTPEFRYSTEMQSLYLSKKLRLKNHKASKILKYINLDPYYMGQVQGFNAGFYIVSNTHFEENYLINLIRKLIEAQKHFSCFNFGTQVVMNLMVVNDRIYIDKVWNHLPNANDNYSLKIIHWNGTEKPWNSKLYTNNIWYEYCFKVYPEYKKIFSYIKKYNDKINVKSKSKEIIINKSVFPSKQQISLLKFINSRNLNNQ